VNFQAILPGMTVFFDSNTFVYHFNNHATLGPPCEQLLERVRKGEIEGVTSSHVLSETAHRLMAEEATATFTWPRTGAAYRLK
jgi:predicted nucleic acid-binding protein